MNYDLLRDKATLLATLGTIPTMHERGRRIWLLNKHKIKWEKLKYSLFVASALRNFFKYGACRNNVSRRAGFSVYFSNSKYANRNFLQYDERSENALLFDFLFTKNK